MQRTNEHELLNAYRQMSREDQIAILAISLDRAKENTKPATTLRLVSSNPNASNTGPLSNVVRRRKN